MGVKGPVLCCVFMGLELQIRLSSSDCNKEWRVSKRLMERLQFMKFTWSLYVLINTLTGDCVYSTVRMSGNVWVYV